MLYYEFYNTNSIILMLYGQGRLGHRLLQAERGLLLVRRLARAQLHAPGLRIYIYI